MYSPKMRYSIILLLSSALLSCRQSTEISGTVTDFENSQPLFGVHIYTRNDYENDTYTDSLGKFQIKNGSFEFWGTSLTVILERENYESKTVTFDHCESEYILLKKSTRSMTK